jgi:hypothetical protein
MARTRTRELAPQRSGRQAVNEGSPSSVSVLGKGKAGATTGQHDHPISPIPVRRRGSRTEALKPNRKVRRRTGHRAPRLRGECGQPNPLPACPAMEWFGWVGLVASVVAAGAAAGALFKAAAGRQCPGSSRRLSLPRPLPSRSFGHGRGGTAGGEPTCRAAVEPRTVQREAPICPVALSLPLCSARVNAHRISQRPAGRKLGDPMRVAAPRAPLPVCELLPPRTSYCPRLRSQVKGCS